jgi:hypothetical protein
MTIDPLIIMFIYIGMYADNVPKPPCMIPMPSYIDCIFSCKKTTALNTYAHFALFPESWDMQR